MFRKVLMIVYKDSNMVDKGFSGVVNVWDFVVLGVKESERINCLGT